MKATIESTAKIVEINGIPARIWEGKTEEGVNIEMYVPYVVVSEKEASIDFDLELERTPMPRIEIGQ